MLLPGELRTTGGGRLPGRLVLASASPRRREILSLLGVPFEVRPPRGVAEDDARGSAEEVVRLLAARKAARVFEQIGQERDSAAARAVVLGADTVLAAGEGNGRQVLGKPRDGEDARAMLRLLSGVTHEIWTGLAVVSAGLDVRVEVERTAVTFRDLSGADIERYVRGGEPFGKAGAYAIQGEGRSLVAGFSGCYYNIVGLPLVLAARMLDGLVPVPACDCARHELQRGRTGCRRPPPRPPAPSSGGSVLLHP